MKKNRAPQLPVGRRWHFDNSRSAPWSGRPRTVAFLACLLVLLFAQVGGRANVGGLEPLPFSKGFLVTGDYVVGTVDFTSQMNPAVNNLATGIIPISGVPADAHIVAAYLYFEAIHPLITEVNAADTDPRIGIKFRGVPIPTEVIKSTTKQVAAGNATCWGAAGQGSFAVSTYRANVLGLLRQQLDQGGKWTGRYIVNSAELPGNDQNTVTLREKTGNSAIQTAGATLFLVYRVATPSEPLRKIVVYDGLYTAYNTTVSSSTAEADTMSQTIEGFYKSTGPSARITHLVGTGANNQTEHITVTSQGHTVTFGPPPVGADPFPQTSPGSDRSWTAATYVLGTVQNPFMPGTADPGDHYGERVTTTVSASNTTPAACRTWAAVIFSTDVLDADDDGLPDGLEDASLGLKDPNGAELPNLNEMGASSGHKDLFIEINSMKADPGTTYGSADAPYPNTTADCTAAAFAVYDPVTQSCTDGNGHDHIPTPDVLKRIGDRFAAHNIAVHFDVGNLSTYHAHGQVSHSDWVDNYNVPVTNDQGQTCGVSQTNPLGDCYLIPTNLATGGEIIKEAACDSTDPQCIFDAYPGTVGWKLGFLALRNAPVGNNGEELDPNLTHPDLINWLNSTSSEHRVRFDRERRPYFHYALNAHARGTPSSPFPCLVDNKPAGYPQNSTTCAQDNPQFHVPTASRGIADLPGRNMLVALGLWDEFVGRPFARAGGFFHELGHNLNLWHSGVPVAFGNATQPTVIGPNCKPNFLSSMSYLYSVHGLVDIFGNKQVDYSGEQLDNLSENSLFDSFYHTAPPYQRAWYAPANSALALDAGGSAAMNFCGVAGQPVQPMARVVSDNLDSQANTWYIDWDGDRAVDNPSAAQDVNLDGVLNQTFSGYNDWEHVRLDQISANGLTGGNEDYLILFGSIAGDDPWALAGDDPFALAGDDPFALAGDDPFALAGDDPFALAGDDPFALAGDDPFALAGDVTPEPTYAGAKGLGRTAPDSVTACIVEVGSLGCPYGVKADGVTACRVGSPGCTAAQPFTPAYHRVAVSFDTTGIVGHIDHYQVQRKRADPTGGAWEDVVGTNALRTNVIIDPAVLPVLKFTYRVRAHFDDPSGQSAWAYLPAPITAVNDLPNDPPAPQANDSYVTPKNTPITATASGTPAPPGVLGISCGAQNNCNPNAGADRSSDNPTAAYVAKRAVLVSGPVIKDTTTPIGTLVFNANGDGGFTFTPPAFFDGFVTFKYKANDGFWSVDPTVPMNGKDGLGPNANPLFSAPVTVTIEVKKK